MIRTSTPAEELINDPQYPTLKALLIRATGMDYYTDKDDDLASRIHRRMANLSIDDCASYLRVLNDPVSGYAELDDMIADITIGETYFFRHQEHFDALREIVLPQLLARNAQKRSLRIWCAGCADGPEAYSLAILLQRDLSCRSPDWAISILATDINKRALERARQGRFQDWALRATSDEVKRECFVKDGKSWQIAPKYQERVFFEYFNITSTQLPPMNFGAFDLIVCRNVTIYFDSETTNGIINRFHEYLSEGSWLLVGPTEPNMKHFNSFRAVNAPGVTLYQKRKSEPIPPSPPAAALPAASVNQSEPRKSSSPAVVPLRTSRKTSPPVQQTEHTLVHLRLHADRGEWAKALRCCELLLKKDNLNPHTHFFHGLVLQQLGRCAEAEPALKKSIYLDRNSALPHYYLGLLLHSRGATRQAVRSFQNAVELLASLNDEEVFADADGLTVADLRKLAKLQLDALGTR